MAIPSKPAPSVPQQDSISFQKFVGLRNTVERERLGPDELEIAINVDLDDVGELHRRQGIQLVASGNWANIFTSLENQVYGVNNGNLVRVYPNFKTKVMQGGFDPAVPIAYEQFASGKIYWSCRTQNGIIDTTNDTNSPWLGPSLGPNYIPDLLDPNAARVPALPAGTWWLSPIVDPVATLAPIKGRILGPPPFASFLTYYNGRIYMGIGKTVWHTELYLYNYVNKTKNFFSFEADITMIGTVTDGIYVGTTEGLYFLAPAPRIEGHPAGAMKRLRVLDSGVIPGSMVYLPGELGNPPQVGIDQDTPIKISILFMTTKGYCVAQDGGVATNFSESKFVFPAAATASAMYRTQQGYHQYVAVLNSQGTPTSNTRIGDHVDVTLRKAGTWQEVSDQINIVENLSATYISLTTPSWLPSGATAFADFVNGNYYAGGAVTTLAAVLADPSKVTGGALQLAATDNPANFIGTFATAMISGDGTYVSYIDTTSNALGAMPLAWVDAGVSEIQYLAWSPDGGSPGKDAYQLTRALGGGQPNIQGDVVYTNKLEWAFTLTAAGASLSIAKGAVQHDGTASGEATFTHVLVGSFLYGSPISAIGGGPIKMYSLAVYPAQTDAVLPTL